MPALTLATALLAALALSARPPPADVAGRVTKVVDGDTLHVRPEEGSGFPGRKPRELKVRLAGADAPEHDQPHGREARRALEALVEGQDVLLHPLTTDHFGRTLARVEVGDRDVSEALVEAGHAWAFRRYLGTAELPDPDLIIRTSGETRLSNFLLLQGAYAEFVFTPVLWPDFGKADLAAAIAEYARRERRYGLTSEQVASPAK